MAGDGVGTGHIIPAGITDGIILTMVVTGQVIAMATGMVTGIATTGVVDIILTTIHMPITVMDMAGITYTEEGFQDMDITLQMKIIQVRSVAEEAIILSARGVRGHQPQPQPKV